MATQKQVFTTPVGRFVMGNLYEPRTKDFKGNPLVYKTGPDAGKPRSEFFIGIAFPKERDPATGQFKHWAHTPWGQIIWQAGHAYMQSAGQMRDFAWKVDDGDVPRTDDHGRQLPIREGCAGHWVLKLSGGFAPKIYTCVGVPDPRNPAPLLDKGAVNLGDYIQVNGDVEGNGATGQQAGVYVNHRMVCLAGYGQRIVVGPDVASAGFGGQPLPPGASTTPVAGFQQPPQVPGVPGHAPQAPMAPGYPPAGAAVTPPPQMTPPPGAMPSPGGYAPPVQTPVQPNYSYMQPAGMPIPGVQPPQGPPAYAAAAPQAAPVGAMPYPSSPPSVAVQNAHAAPYGVPPGQPGVMPPAGGYPSAMPAPTRQMTPAAMGLPYEAWRQQGWSDEQLIATGRMLP